MCICEFIEFLFVSIFIETFGLGVAKNVDDFQFGHTTCLETCQPILMESEYNGNGIVYACSLAPYFAGCPFPQCAHNTDAFLFEESANL